MSRKLFYRTQVDDKLLLDICEYYGVKGSNTRIGSAACSECKFYVNNNLITQVVTCNAPSKKEKVLTFLSLRKFKGRRKKIKFDKQLLFEFLYVYSFMLDRLFSICSEHENTIVPQELKLKMFHALSKKERDEYQGFLENRDKRRKPMKDEIKEAQEKWIEEKNINFKKYPISTLIDMLNSTNNALKQIIDCPDGKTARDIAESAYECNNLFLGRVGRENDNDS